MALKKHRFYDYYCTLKLSELRRRQDITVIQITYCYRQVSKRGYNWERYEKALIRLQRISDILSLVVAEKYCK